MSVLLNWTFRIVCNDCGAEYDVGNPNPSVTRLAKGLRMVMLMIPNECPSCHNLKVIQGGVIHRCNPGEHSEYADDSEKEK